MSEEKEETIVTSQGSVTLNTKTVIQIGALLLGAALGGGGVSFAASPAEPLAQLKEEIERLKASVETVAVAAVEIKAELRQSRKTEERLEEAIKDHEERLRALERN